MLQREGVVTPLRETHVPLLCHLTSARLIRKIRFIYVPTPLEDLPNVGSDSFTYKIFDGAAWSSLATVTINLTNTLPTGRSNSYRFHHTENFTKSAADGVLRDDTDFDGDAIEAKLDDNVAHGEITLESDGSFIYLPTAGYVGSDSFTYRVFDGAEYSSPITVNLEVWNAIPTGVQDVYSMHHGTSQSFSSVLGNDVDWDGDTMTAKFSAPSQGTLDPHSDGTFTYTPGRVDAENEKSPDFTGNVTFSYQIFDGVQYSAPTSVSIQVRNSLPIGIDDFAMALRGKDVTVTGNVLTNDSDPDGDKLSVSLIDVPDKSIGSVVLEPDGTFTFSAQDTFAGETSFRYRVSDGAGHSPDDVTVTIRMTDALLYAASDTFPAGPYGEYSDNVLNNDKFTSGRTRVGVVQQPTSGTVEIDQDGHFTFTPADKNIDPKVYDSAEFKYWISDYPDAAGKEPRETASVVIQYANFQVSAVADEAQ